MFSPHDQLKGNANAGVISPSIDYVILWPTGKYGSVAIARRRRKIFTIPGVIYGGKYRFLKGFRSIYTWDPKKFPPAAGFL